MVTSGPCWATSGGVPAAIAAWVFWIDSWKTMNWTLVVAPVALSKSSRFFLISGWRLPPPPVSRVQISTAPLTFLAAGAAAAGAAAGAVAAAAGAAVVAAGAAVVAAAAGFVASAAGLAASVGFDAASTGFLPSA